MLINKGNHATLQYEKIIKKTMISKIESQCKQK
jgi:hypothetical protein